MKDKNYYEILGVASHVGSGQIQAAYRFARSLYAGESTPTHGLLDATERAVMLELVEEAYGTLSNPNGRREYDISLGARSTRTDASRNNVQSEARAPAPPTAERRSATPAIRLADPAPAPAPAPIAIEPVQVPEVVNGSVLKSLREKRGLSVDQIAALSKVGGRFLRALEEDRHEALPGRVFARGFLIEYARAIHVSESEIVERYLRHWTSK